MKKILLKILTAAHMPIYCIAYIIACITGQREEMQSPAEFWGDAMDLDD